jgi:hypothetical protein
VCFENSFSQGFACEKGVSYSCSTEQKRGPSRNRNITRMPLFFCAAAIAAVSVIYLFWRSYQTSLFVRRRVIRERVAHLLWIMADVDEKPSSRKLVPEVDSPLDVA